MEKKSGKHNRFAAFLKRNVYYVIMGVCILAIGAMVTLSLLNTEEPPLDNQPIPVDPGDPTGPTDPTDPTGPTDPTDPTGPADPIVFSMPVENGHIIQDYTMDSLVFNVTLNQFQVKRGISFGGPTDANVYAVYDGVVESVTYDALKGHVVVIRHSDEIVTSYGSLKEAPTLKAGDTIKKGDVIGKIGVSATAEFKEGPHVNFKVYQNGNIVNPHDFFPEGDK